MTAFKPHHLKTLRNSARTRLQSSMEKVNGWIESRFDDGAMSQAFKPDAAAIEEAPVPLSAHAALYAIIALLAASILWSVFGSVDRIVVAPGKMATRTPLVVMQPFTTSRILSLPVRPGDHVKKGQVLVSFDPAFAEADVASLEHKVRSLAAQTERLEAQLAGTPFLPQVSDPPERKTQNDIYNQEMASYAAELAQRYSRAAALASQLQADNAAIAGLQQQQEMANKVVMIYQRLVEQKAGAPLDVMKAQSNAVDITMKLTSTIGDARKLSEQRSEAEAERRAFLDKWRSDHNQQLVQSRQNLAEASETLNKARRMREFTALRAPADGTVLQLADRSVGSVLREAETAVTLVPDGADLYIEATVPSRDVSYLTIGQPVRIKLEAYPFQRYGTLNGTLTVLSPDSVPLKEGDSTELVYRAQVRLSDKADILAKKGLLIRPGLVASAEIKTGKRSIASYILNPILRTADEGMREP